MIHVSKAIIFTPDECAPFVGRSQYNPEHADYRPSGLCRNGVYAGSHGSSEQLSLWPAYAHRPDVVELMVGELAVKVGLVAFDELYWRVHNVPFHTLSDANGGTHEDANYYGDDQADPPQQGRKVPVYNITFLWGRLVGGPIHPAVTQYLVAHEFGHAINNVFCDDSSRKRVDYAYWLEYKERRGLAKWDEPRFARWHESATEIFADDVRTALNVERWPMWNHAPVDETPEWFKPWLLDVLQRPHWQEVEAA